MRDEGYIKFRAHWKQTPPLAEKEWQELNQWRQKIYNQGLIGVYPDGIGFGNISCRAKGDEFIISGSASGRFPVLDGRHYSRVRRVEVQKNTLWCEGPIMASSESMSHAVIYQELPDIRGVIHIHHLKLWEQLLHRIPTTGGGIPYGSPDMARSIRQLIHTTKLGKLKIFVMEGHREGVFTFGKNLAEASRILDNWMQKIKRAK